MLLRKKPVHIWHTIKRGLAEVCQKKPVQYVPDMSAIPPDASEPDVIIIGAGLAGLSAAQRLVQCDITSFRIVEATERAGGRVKTGWLGDTITEMGAEYVHGASIANTVYTLAAQEGLLKVPVRRRREAAGGTAFFGSDGRPMSGELVGSVARRFSSMVAKASDAASATSLASHFNKLIGEDLKSELDSFNAARIYFGLMNDLSSRIGSSLSKASARYLGVQEELPGGSARVQLGMGGILAPLLRGLPTGAEYYSKPVQVVKWGTAGAPGPRAVVKCRDGEEMCADYVIVTVPLGVLKKEADTFFCPPLPANKMDAIKKLGFGHVGKIYLEYQEPFWVGDWGFGLAWSPEELKTKDSWVTGISGVKAVSKKVLAVQVYGEEGSRMELCPDEEVARQVTTVLRRFLRDSSIPRPVGITRTDWSSSPFFNGGLTYMGLESGPGNIKDIATPIPSECEHVPPIILFAGEHTDHRFYGTLHGARISGIRAADRIVELTKIYKGSPTKSPEKEVCPPCK